MFAGQTETTIQAPTQICDWYVCVHSLKSWDVRLVLFGRDRVLAESQTSFCDLTEGFDKGHAAGLPETSNGEFADADDSEHVIFFADAIHRSVSYGYGPGQAIWSRRTTATKSQTKRKLSLFPKIIVSLIAMNLISG